MFFVLYAKVRRENFKVFLGILICSNAQFDKASVMKNVSEKQYLQFKLSTRPFFSASYPFCKCFSRLNVPPVLF